MNYSVPNNSWSNYLNRIPFASIGLLKSNPDTREAYDVFSSVVSENRPNAYGRFVSNRFNQTNNDYKKRMYENPMASWLEFLAEKEPSLYEDWSFANNWERGTGPSFGRPLMGMRWGS